ncbi:MAG: hypothetical protein V1744_07845 [Candidatus Altiarchaeota archaeon]
MDDLTDDLVWQGLNLDQYNKLDPDSQEQIRRRASQFRRLKDMGLVAELLIAVASELGDGKSDVIASIIDGRNPDGEEFVRKVVIAYKKSGMKTDIGEFYRKNYTGGIAAFLAGSHLLK